MDAINVLSKFLRSELHTHLKNTETDTKISSMKFDCDLSCHMFDYDCF